MSYIQSIIALLCFVVFTSAEVEDVVYDVHVKTSKWPQSGTGGDAYIDIHGERGDIKKIKLTHPLTLNKPLQQGYTDKFQFTLPNVGQIESITVTLEMFIVKRSWLLEEIRINTSRSDLQYVFLCMCWFNKDHRSQEIQGLHYNPIPNPGFKARITDVAMKYITGVALTYGMTVYQDMAVPDRYYDKIVAGVGLTDIKILNMTLPEVMISTENSIYTVDIKIERLKILANYYATILKIMGRGFVNVQADNFQLRIQIDLLRSDSSTPMIELIDCGGEADFELQFKGGHDTVLNFFTKTLPSLVNEEAYNDICTTTKEAISDQINPLIEENYPSQINIMETGLCLDISLPYRLDILTDATEISPKGVFTWECAKNPDIFYEGKIPEIPYKGLDNSKMVYAYLTDYVINSALDSAFEGGLLKYDVTKDVIPEEFLQYIKYIQMMIPGLTSDGHPVLSLSSLDVPQVNFIDGDVKLKANLNLELNYDESPEILFITTIHLNITVLAEISYSNSTLQCKIKEIDSEHAIVKSDYEQFGILLNTVLKPGLVAAKIYVNTLCSKGVKLEIPDFSDVIQIKDAEVFIDDKYNGILYASTNLDLSLDSIELI